MAKKKALPVQHGEGEIETVSLPPAAATAWRELQGAVWREYEGMHGKVTANTEASSGEQWSRTMDLVDEIKLKLDQAYGICNVVRQARDLHIDQSIPDSLYAASDLIEESKEAFDELWETVIKRTHNMVPVASPPAQSKDQP